jgi:hypothetical protein
VTSTAGVRGTLQGGRYGLAAGDGKARVSEVDLVDNGTGIVGFIVMLENVALRDNTQGAIHLNVERGAAGYGPFALNCAASFLIDVP